ncbi:MAG TPA: hypothetical protein VFV50_01425 [Bdellovibrionales bacterium]|nr:hypothetical protein [Bdellovibrionales bacterium]
MNRPQRAFGQDFAAGVLLVAALFVSAPAAAQRYGPGGPSSTGDRGLTPIGETQKRRSAERFSIIDWIREQNATRAAQDARWGRGGSSGRGPFPDFVLHYRTSPMTISREGTKVGTASVATGRFQFLLDDLFSSGNRMRVINSDLGIEFSYAQAKDFLADTAFTQSKYEFKELSGAFLIRPIGRSSQDSGLTVKAGYHNFEETGFWTNTTTPENLYGMFLGADVTLDLVPFLGLKGEYQHGLEGPAGSYTGKWKISRFTYGAFLEIYLINLEAFMFNNEAVFTPDAGAPVKETQTGTGFGASLFF